MGDTVDSPVVSPINESTESPPIDESTQIPSINESTESPPIDESTQIPPINELIEIPPIDESTQESTQSQELIQCSPINESTQCSPINDSTQSPPINGSAQNEGGKIEANENQKENEEDKSVQEEEDASIDDPHYESDTNYDDVLDEEPDAKSDTVSHSNEKSKDSTASPAPTNFSACLSNALGGRYSNGMRRSVQAAVLYEANRCLSSRYSVLRPFQRKVALYGTAKDIIDTLDYIPVYQRMEVMFRTQAAKLPLSPELAWRRMKVIDREVEKSIVCKIKPFLDKGKTHEEVCEEFIRSEYEKHATGVEGKERPVNWEYSHLNNFLIYRMFYLGESRNPNLPMAVDPNPNRVVPVKKPPFGTYPGEELPFSKKMGNKGKKRPHDDTEASKNAQYTYKAATPTERRRALLKEVREHLELLKEFEGVISAKDLTKKKKELFNSLPPAPEGKVDKSRSFKTKLGVEKSTKRANKPAK